MLDTQEIEREIKTNEGLVMTFLRQSRVVDFKRVQSEPMFTALRKERGPFHQKGMKYFFVAKTGTFGGFFPA